MDTIERYAQRTINTHFQECFRHTLIQMAGHFFGVIGILAILLRLGTNITPIVLFLLLIFWLPWSYIVASTQRMTRGQAYTWLDVQAGGGGELVTMYEVDDLRWQDAAQKKAENVEIRFVKSKKMVLLYTLGASLFMMLSFWMPTFEAEDTTALGLLIDKKIELEEKQQASIEISKDRA